MFIRLPKEITKEKKDKHIPINHHVKNVLGNIPRSINHDFIFTHRGKPFLTDQAMISFKTACRKAGIPYGQKVSDGITFHDIRRTVKTNMLNAGLDKAHRDIILGHSLQGMDAHYLKPSDEDLRKAMDKYTEWLDEKVSEISSSYGNRLIEKFKA